jgi:hypothetical protein
MFDNLLGSIAGAIPGLNLSSSSNQGGLGGIVNSLVSPIAKAVTTASTFADQFVAPLEKAAVALTPGPLKPLVQSVEDTLDGGAPQADGSLPSGLKVEVNVLKGVVSAQSMDATSKAHIQSALDNVKSGEQLDSALSPLTSSEKSLLANTIGNAGFEPPDCLKSYLSNQSEGDSSRMDCALKNVEVYEKSGYQATEASHLFRFLPLGPVLLGG